MKFPRIIKENAFHKLVRYVPDELIDNEVKGKPDLLLVIYRKEKSIF